MSVHWVRAAAEVSFFGFTPKHNISHCIKAILEGVAFDLKQSLEIIELKKINLGEMRAIGGGAKSKLWCEIKSNIYGKNIKTLKNFEGGIVGGAILAGLGAGVFENVKNAVQHFVSLDKIYIPDNKKTRFYQKKYLLYKELHNSMQKYFLKLAKLKIEDYT